MIIQYHNVTPSKVEYIQTGLPIIDLALGGFPLNTSMVFSGEPGTGKSTIAALIAMKFDAIGQSTLYVAGEERPEQITPRIARLGKVNGFIDFLVDDGRIYVEDVIAALEARSYKFVVIDSLQKLYTRSRGAYDDLGSNSEAATIIYNYQQRHPTFSLFCISQFNKQGKPQGKLAIVHQMDNQILTKKTTESTIKKIIFEKTRFCETPEDAYYKLVEHGVDGLSEAEFQAVAMPKGKAEAMRKIIVQTKVKPRHGYWYTFLNAYFCRAFLGIRPVRTHY